MANRPEGNFNQEVSMLIDTASAVLQFPEKPHIGLFRVEFADQIGRDLTGKATLERWPPLRQLSVIGRSTRVSDSEVRVNLSSDPLSSPDQAVAYFLRKNDLDQPNIEVDGPQAILQIRSYLQSLEVYKTSGVLVITPILAPNRFQP